MRYKLLIAYDGSYFYGFQRQKNLNTVQNEIEKCLTLIFKEEIKIKGAGRTDALVHAYGQVAHFDHSQRIPLNKLQKAMNKILSPHIYIKNIEIVGDNFHSRIDAKIKEYRYYISANEFDPLKSNYIYFYNKEINTNLLNDALKLFIGTKDFKSLSKGHEKENTIRTIYSFELNQKDGIYEFIIKGNGFLRNMVRIIIAILLKLNENKISLEDIQKIIDGTNRKFAPWVAPANGLYLYNIEY